MNISIATTKGMKLNVVKILESFQMLIPGQHLATHLRGDHHPGS